MSHHFESATLRETAIPNIQVTVTVDMCQSSRTWESGLFEWMVDLSEGRGEPTQVGITMTGLWAHRHTNDFQQLLDWQARHYLDKSQLPASALT